MMKRTILLILSVISFEITAAPVVTNILSLQALATVTTNLNANTSGASVPARVYFLQNLGLANTNAEIVSAQVSLDNTNFVTYSTFKHAATNAAIDTFTADPNPLVLYFRVSVQTTNTVSVGVSELK